VDLYLDFNTPLHRLDPRAKVFGLLGAFALLLAFNHPLYTAGVAAVILAMALESRGFSSPGPRTEYLELRARWQDCLVSALLLVAVTASISWRLAGHGAVLPRV